jgi:ADP-heptose:LPS heptosyltransferase
MTMTALRVEAGSAMIFPVNNPPRRALFIHQGAIGDFLVASRLIGLCNDVFDSFSWDLLGKPAMGRLARTLGLIDECYDFSLPGWHLLFSPDSPIDAECSSMLSRYDLILNVVAGPQTTFARRLAEFAKGRLIHVEPKLPETYSRHVYQYLAEQIVGVPIDDLPSNAYRVDPEVISEVREKLRERKIDPENLMIIHPGASGESKRWPLKNFLQIAELLRRRNVTTVFLLGEVELEQFSGRAIESIKKAGHLFADWPLEHLAALIRLSGRYLGNDNGISHLAGVIGAETQVIFVRNNAANWKPLGPRVIVTGV